MLPDPVLHRQMHGCFAHMSKLQLLPRHIQAIDIAKGPNRHRTGWKILRRCYSLAVTAYYQFEKIIIGFQIYL